MADHNNIDSYGFLHYDLRQFLPNSIISDTKKKIASSTFCNGVDYKQKYNFVLLRILLMSVLIISLRSSFIQRGKNNFSPNFPGFPGVCSAWTKFCQNFRIQEQFKKQSGSVLFHVHLFQARKKKKKKKKKKTEKNGWMLLLVKLQALGPLWEFFTFFQLYKWYQIAQRATDRSPLDYHPWV